MDGNKSQSHEDESHRVTVTSHESAVLPVKKANRSLRLLDRNNKKSEGGAGFPIPNIKSKVGNLYGAAIRKQLEEMAFLIVRNVDITIEDAGALPFLLAARFEAAVKAEWPQQLHRISDAFLYEDINPQLKITSEKSPLSPGNELNSS
ncbi:MAG: hypothetical protein IPI12_14270 [Ignavibacteriales bacterium]|nr:hypothetical protein [Ignavibacteriales bacterium]